MKNKNLYISGLSSVLGSLAIMVLLSGCVGSMEFELPESNSQLDTALPTADFTEQQDVVDYRLYQFQNLSAESTKFDWEFGDGGTSTDMNPLHTFEGGEGTYSVTLNTADDNGVTATITRDVVVVEPEAPAALEPPILEHSFEDNALEDGSGDGRDSWRNSSLGGVIQITSGPLVDGDQAAKFPAEGDRIAYQELEVTPNADYKFTYYYTMKTDQPGSITFDVLAGGGHVDTSGEVLGSFTGSDQTDANAYVESTVEFNSGANGTISIYIHNEGEECRLDLVSIEAVE